MGMGMGGAQQMGFNAEAAYKNEKEALGIAKHQVEIEFMFLFVYFWFVRGNFRSDSGGSRMGGFGPSSSFFLLFLVCNYFLICSV